MKKSLLNKFLEKIIPAFVDKHDDATSDELVKMEELTPKPDDPQDVTFAKKFTSQGGKFTYCENLEDFYINFKNLLEESPWEKTYCSNDELKKLLKPTELYFEDDFNISDSSISTCEFLIAFNGSVMVSGQQTKNIKIEELPEALIIVAYTSQIVKNIGEGLRGIQNKYGKSRPSLVTSIRTKESTSMMSDSDRTKNLHIFLIEDFKEHR
jgi:hypothetical protein